MATITSSSNVDWSSIDTGGVDIADDVQAMAIYGQESATLVRNMVGIQGDVVSGSTLTGTYEGVLFSGLGFLYGNVKFTGSGYAFRPTVKISQVQFTAPGDGEPD